MSDYSSSSMSPYRTIQSHSYSNRQPFFPGLSRIVENFRRSRASRDIRYADPGSRLVDLEEFKSSAKGFNGESKFLSSISSTLASVEDKILGAMLSVHSYLRSWFTRDPEERFSKLSTDRSYLQYLSTNLGTVGNPKQRSVTWKSIDLLKSETRSSKKPMDYRRRKLVMDAMGHLRTLALSLEPVDKYASVAAVTIIDYFDYHLAGGGDTRSDELVREEVDDTITRHYEACRRGERLLAEEQARSLLYTVVPTVAATAYFLSL